MFLYQLIAHVELYQRSFESNSIRWSVRSSFQV